MSGKYTAAICIYKHLLKFLPGKNRDIKPAPFVRFASLKIFAVVMGCLLSTTKPGGQRPKNQIFALN
jgi:hypothetical protein